MAKEIDKRKELDMKISDEDIEKIVDLGLDKRLLSFDGSTDETSFWIDECDLHEFIKLIVNGLYLDERLHKKYGWRSLKD